MKTNVVSISDPKNAYDSQIHFRRRDKLRLNELRIRQCDILRLNELRNGFKATSHKLRACFLLHLCAYFEEELKQGEKPDFVDMCQTYLDCRSIDPDWYPAKVHENSDRISGLRFEDYVKIENLLKVKDDDFSPISLFLHANAVIIDMLQITKQEQLLMGSIKAN